jgi:hypothetical protein
VKVLFDHILPHKLRTTLAARSRHEIVTTAFLGRGHLKNGELLSAAEQSGIEVFVTGDRTMVHEQNLAGRWLAIIVLSSNNWPIVRDYLPHILAAIDGATPGSFQAVACGMFSRKSRS